MTTGEGFISWILWMFIGTCHGYSFSSVSTPPTILIVVWTLPQLQVVVGMLPEIVVVSGDVVVDGDDVVVEVVDT